MAHLFILALSFIFISAGLIDREECCSEKTVGGVHYTLVEKTNTEVYNCLSNCVYIRTGDSGSRFCFAKGNQHVECNNAEGIVFGIVVAGGNDPGKSTELFLPGSGKQCKLADLPDSRFACTLDNVSDTPILCGGGALNSEEKNCLVFIPNTNGGKGSWTYQSPYQLKTKRTGHSSWSAGNAEWLLMGGKPSYRTTEILDPSSSFSNLSFNLIEKTIYACSIQLTDYVILTGGQFSLIDVIKYNTKGHVKDPNLPNLPDDGGRYLHGCGSYQKGTILVVAGGIGSDKETILSSTLFYTIGSSAWKKGNPLPKKGALYAMASVIYENTIMLIGGNDASDQTVLNKNTKQILTYIKNKANNEMIWTTLKVNEKEVKLLDARSFGAACTMSVDATVCD